MGRKRLSPQKKKKNNKDGHSVAQAKRAAAKYYSKYEETGVSACPDRPRLLIVARKKKED